MASKLGWILVGLVLGIALWLLARAADAAVSDLLAGLLILWSVIATWLWLRGLADEGAADRRGASIDASPQAPLPGDLISIESLPDPAVLLDSRQRVIAANTAALQLNGRAMIGEDLAVAVRHPVAHEAVRRAIGSGEQVDRDLVGLGRPEGLVRLRVAPAAGGRLLLTFADITQARAVERTRADFVANASHELRTPLATILGFIETLQGPAAKDEPARSRFLGIMAREARRMARLIDDLMSLSRIELDKYIRPLDPLALPPLLAEVGRTLAMQLEEAGSEFRLEADPSLPQVTADRDQILQVMNNLVTNAMKYGRPGTPVMVTAVLERSAGRQGDFVRVSVADEGPGIASEHIPRLTERFYRVDPSRSRQMSGTGLGLAIVKHILERHRGELSIDSRLGIGTTISFTLPVAPRQQQAAETAAQPAIDGRLHRNETELS